MKTSPRMSRPQSSAHFSPFSFLSCLARKEFFSSFLLSCQSFLQVLLQHLRTVDPNWQWKGFQGKHLIVLLFSVFKLSPPTLMLTDIELCKGGGWHVIFKSKEKRDCVWTEHTAYCVSVSEAMEEKTTCVIVTLHNTLEYTSCKCRGLKYTHRGILMAQVMFHKHLNIPKYHELRLIREQWWTSFVNNASPCLSAHFSTFCNWDVWCCKHPIDSVIISHDNWLLVISVQTSHDHSVVHL